MVRMEMVLSGDQTILDWTWSKTIIHCGFSNSFLLQLQQLLYQVQLPNVVNLSHT